MPVPQRTVRQRRAIVNSLSLFTFFCKSHRIERYLQKSTPVNDEISISTLNARPIASVEAISTVL